MTWVIEAEEAFDSFSRETDPIDDSELRLAVGDCLIAWRSEGPPAEAVYNERRQVLECDVPGTPVVVEYISLPYLDPPVVLVRKLRWERPPN